MSGTSKTVLPLGDVDVAAAQERPDRLGDVEIQVEPRVRLLFFPSGARAGGGEVDALQPLERVVRQRRRERVEERRLVEHRLEFAGLVAERALARELREAVERGAAEQRGPPARGPPGP